MVDLSGHDQAMIKSDTNWKSRPRHASLASARFLEGSERMKSPMRSFPETSLSLTKGPTWCKDVENRTRQATLYLIYLYVLYMVIYI